MHAPHAAPAATSVSAPAAPKPPWRFAAERRLGRLARRLVGVAESEIPLAVAVLGADTVLAACRAPRWALTCLELAAACEDGSESQGAWVLLAACRPALVRRAIHGDRPARPNRHARNRQPPGTEATARLDRTEDADADRR